MNWALRDLQEDKTIHIRRVSTKVGRRGNADINTTFAVVSRDHAEFLVLGDGSLCIEDHQSSNGTYVNNVLIQPRIRITLRPNDIVGFGYCREAANEREITPDYLLYQVIATRYEVIVIDDTPPPSPTLLQADENEDNVVTDSEEIIEIDDNDDEPEIEKFEDVKPPVEDIDVAGPSGTKSPKNDSYKQKDVVEPVTINKKCQKSESVEEPTNPDDIKPKTSDIESVPTKFIDSSVEGSHQKTDSCKQQVITGQSTSTKDCQKTESVKEKGKKLKNVIPNINNIAPASAVGSHQKTDSSKQLVITGQSISTKDCQKTESVKEKGKKLKNVIPDIDNMGIASAVGRHQKTDLFKQQVITGHSTSNKDCQKTESVKEKGKKSKNVIPDIDNMGIASAVGRHQKTDLFKQQVITGQSTSTKDCQKTESVKEKGKKLKTDIPNIDNIGIASAVGRHQKTDSSKQQVITGQSTSTKDCQKTESVKEKGKKANNVNNIGIPSADNSVDAQKIDKGIAPESLWEIQEDIKPNFDWIKQALSNLGNETNLPQTTVKQEVKEEPSINLENDIEWQAPVFKEPNVPPVFKEPSVPIKEEPICNDFSTVDDCVIVEDDDEPFACSQLISMCKVEKTDAEDDPVIKSLAELNYKDELLRDSPPIVELDDFYEDETDLLNQLLTQELNDAAIKYTTYQERTSELAQTNGHLQHLANHIDSFNFDDDDVFMEIDEDELLNEDKTEENREEDDLKTALAEKEQLQNQLDEMREEEMHNQTDSMEKFEKGGPEHQASNAEGAVIQNITESRKEGLIESSINNIEECLSKETDIENETQSRKEGSIAQESSIKNVKEYLPKNSKYVIPPIIEPPFMKPRKKTSEKRKSTEQVSHEPKKKPKLTTSRSSRSKSTESTHKDNTKKSNKHKDKNKFVIDPKEKREIRKNRSERLKELSNKHKSKKEPHQHKHKSEVKVKTSEGRGGFLLEEPSTSKHTSPKEVSAPKKLSFNQLPTFDNVNIEKEKPQNNVPRIPNTNNEKENPQNKPTFNNVNNEKEKPQNNVPRIPNANNEKENPQNNFPRIPNANNGKEKPQNNVPRIPLMKHKQTKSRTPTKCKGKCSPASNCGVNHNNAVDSNLVDKSKQSSSNCDILDIKRQLRDPRALQPEKRQKRDVELIFPDQFLHEKNLMNNSPISSPEYNDNTASNILIAEELKKLTECLNNTIYSSAALKRITRWVPKWLQEQKGSSKSPPVSEYKIGVVPDKFNCYAEYVKTMNVLILLESWKFSYDAWVNNRETDNCKLIRVKVVHKRAVRELSYIDCQDEKNHLCFHCFAATVDTMTRDMLRENYLVCLEMVNEDEERETKETKKSTLQRYFAFVTKCNNSRVKDPLTGKFVFELRFTVALKLDGKVLSRNEMLCTIIANIAQYAGLMKNIKALEKSPLLHRILNPTSDNFTTSFSDLSLEDIESVKLNSMQSAVVREAVQICTQNDPGMYLIQGPPGTGKSTVIVNIILQILFGFPSQKPKILLTAPSNAAVDSLILKLNEVRKQMSAQKRRRIKILRVGVHNSVHADTKSFHLKELSKKHLFNKTIHYNPNIKAEYDKLQRLIKALGDEYHKLRNKEEDTWQIEKALNDAKYAAETEHFLKTHLSDYSYQMRTTEMNVLSGCNIFCCTVNSCAGWNMENAIKWSTKELPFYFTCCIMDEATQCTELEGLTPLQLGIKKIVLVGDPQQLPATVLSMEAKQLQAGKSLFTRISNNFLNVRPSPVRMLNIQYRMHEEIVQFPNKRFYKRKLATIYNLKNKIRPSLVPYLVFNLENKSYMTQYHNENEITFVRELIHILTSTISESCEYSIGVITPYNTQKDAITKNLPIHRLKNVSITVNTVDSFQGQEKDIIIISYVRNMPNSFLQDAHRINVAITRARQALFIVGTYDLFKFCPVLYDMREDAKRRNLCRDILHSDPHLALRKLVLFN